MPKFVDDIQMKSSPTGAATTRTVIDTDGNLTVTALTIDENIVAAPSYSDEGSYQTVEADLNVAAAAGSADGADPSFIGAVMGNVIGDDLTKDANYLGGVIGHYNVTGTKATTYPAGAVLAGIGDGVTEADGAVVAYIDGDSAQTNAGAAFKVRNNNSTAASGFDYGLDLYDAAHDGYSAVEYKVADVRVSANLNIYSGVAATRAAVRALVGDSAPQGSLFIGTSSVATTKPNLYVKVLDAGADTDWERIVTQAAD